MGSKRPDQYRPGEPGSTDYKFRDDDEHIKAREKQELTTTRADLEERIPARGENPVLAELRERKDAADDQEDAAHDQENEHEGGNGRAERSD